LIGLRGSPSMSMSWPAFVYRSWLQPTAQYGQRPSVTVAPRSREDFSADRGLKGWIWGRDGSE
jgi:hypothetical protein